MTQQPLIADIAFDVALECVDASGQIHQIDTVLGYNRTDPFAMSMTFLATDEPLTWTFGRDLVIAGLHVPTGEGDVSVAPAIDESGRATVQITLSSPDGSLVLGARTDQLSAFLDDTLALVPSGDESINLNVDDLITQLLG